MPETELPIVERWIETVESAIPPDNIEAFTALRGLIEWGYANQRDSLSHTVTRLPNRRALEQRDRLHRPGAIEHRRQHEPDGNFALYIDLDNFKLINDVLGHNTGDTTLRVVGNVLERSLREGYELYHVGGDEFFVFGHKYPDQPSDIPSRIKARFNENLAKIRSGDTTDILPAEIVLNGIERSH